MCVEYTLLQFYFLNKDLEWPNCICVPFTQPLMKRFSEIINFCKVTIGEEMFELSWFFIISVSETSYMYKKSTFTNMSRDIISYSWRILTCIQVSIMLHFLNRLNPINPLKHTVKSYWISLNNWIISKSWKYFLTNQVNIHKVKQWTTLITVRII